MLNPARTKAVRGDAERGAATTALIMVVSLLLLAFAMSYHLRLARVVDQVSGLHTAADSAALAGAESIRGNMWGQLVSSAAAGKDLPSNLGQDEARTFASRNGGTLTSYTYDPRSDRIRVTVESKGSLETGKTERTTGVAKVGHKIARCLPQKGFTVAALNGVPWDVPFRCGEIDVTMHVTPPGHLLEHRGPGQVQGQVPRRHHR